VVRHSAGGKPCLELTESTLLSSFCTSAGLFLSWWSFGLGLGVHGDTATMGARVYGTHLLWTGSQHHGHTHFMISQSGFFGGFPERVRCL